VIAALESLGLNHVGVLSVGLQIKLKLGLDYTSSLSVVVKAIGWHVNMEELCPILDLTGDAPWLRKT